MHVETPISLNSEISVKPTLFSIGKHRRVYVYARGSRNGIFRHQFAPNALLTVWSVFVWTVRFLWVYNIITLIIRSNVEPGRGRGVHMAGV
jgi:hypothetical protein